MFGLFNLFGRSAELRMFDRALRDAGLHPQIVPEPVKLTALRLMQAEAGKTLPEGAHDAAAALIGYCMLGREQFTASTDPAEADRVEARLETAIAEGEGLDARLVLLTLHAGVIAPEVADRFEVETG